ncbi:MAG: hypothetical protein ACRDRW_11190 [Pseudonocardiaceae bacterium]
MLVGSVGGDPSSNARGRVEHFFQLHDAMRQCNTLYRQLGGLPPITEREIPSGNVVALGS